VLFATYKNDLEKQTEEKDIRKEKYKHKEKEYGRIEKLKDKKKIKLFSIKLSWPRSHIRWFNGE
jgi:hypothetical protein